MVSENGHELTTNVAFYHYSKKKKFHFEHILWPDPQNYKDDVSNLLK